MPSHGNDGLLMILRPLNPSVNVHDMRAGHSALVNRDQIPNFDESPLQRAIHVTADLPHARAPTAGIHSGHKARVTREVFGGREPTDGTDFEHQNHA